MTVHPHIEVGQVWEDKRSTGREVQVLEIHPDVIEVETTRAADSASTARAVGRVTRVKAITWHACFAYLRD